MTDYERSYMPPVFHTEKASKTQLKTLQVVFDTLLNSGIDFCVVQSTESADTLEIRTFGDFSLNEKGEILTEVVEMYMDDLSLNHISLE